MFSRRYSTYVEIRIKRRNDRPGSLRTDWQWVPDSKLRWSLSAPCWPRFSTTAWRPSSPSARKMEYTRPSFILMAATSRDRHCPNHSTRPKIILLTGWETGPASAWPVMKPKRSLPRLSWRTVSFATVGRLSPDHITQGTPSNRITNRKKWNLRKNLTFVSNADTYYWANMRPTKYLLVVKDQQRKARYLETELQKVVINILCSQI